MNQDRYEELIRKRERTGLTTEEAGELGRLMAERDGREWEGPRASAAAGAPTVPPVRRPPPPPVAPSRHPDRRPRKVRPVPPERPGEVTSAGVLLSILGWLTIVLSVVALFFIGRALGEVPLVTVVILLGLAMGIAEVMAGRGTLRQRAWARILGIVLCLLGILRAVVNAFGPESLSDLLLELVILAAYTVALVQLARNREAFV